MKISNKLPRFKDAIALLIVTGDKESTFYLAADGLINKTEQLIVRKPVYSDKEGFFAHGGSDYYSAGSVKEISKQFLWKEFLQQFMEELNLLENKYKPTEYYLFTPDYFVNQLLNELPKVLKAKIKQTETGNFSKLHPFELLEKIKLATDAQKITPKTEPHEVKFLLQKEEAVKQLNN
jgi:hypothetical protein